MTDAATDDDDIPLVRGRCSCGYTTDWSTVDQAVLSELRDHYARAHAGDDVDVTAEADWPTLVVGDSAVARVDPSAHP